jgi:hypothetical protein
VNHFKDAGVDMFAGPDGVLASHYVTEVGVACPICGSLLTNESRVPVQLVLAEKAKDVSAIRANDAARLVGHLAMGVVDHMLEAHQVKRQAAWPAIASQIAAVSIYSLFRHPPKDEDDKPMVLEA